ncbi:MAG: homoserine dehydrogenase [Chloroflexaceae bacterium]|nr:homoserine dehydrogenase [Chloroflexaceae bacterium]
MGEMLILQIGTGGVGRALIQQILDQHEALKTRYGLKIGYLALIDRSGALSTGEMLSYASVAAALTAKQAGRSVATLPDSRAISDWRDLLPENPCIVVDLTAADGLDQPLAEVVSRGHRVVLANKRPLTSTLSAFHALTAHGHTRYEATVGAGLPVISTIQALLDSGDTMVRIQSSMSGTLGYLCTALEQGISFSSAVRTARTRGWTEPDPRDDLSGIDVARKALILARTCGMRWELNDIPMVPWFPPEFAHLTVDQFMEQLTDLDAIYAERILNVQREDAALRYVATVEPDGVSVGLQELPLNHPLASLRGTDNLFALTTSRYREEPLVVRGPGAGVDVTAAGVFADILVSARELAR